MNKFEVLQKVTVEDQYGKYDRNIRISSVDYEPANISSINNCIDQTIKGLEEAEVEHPERWIPNAGYINAVRTNGFTARFAREDGTIIDEIDLNNHEDIALAKDFFGKFFMV